MATKKRTTTAKKRVTSKTKTKSPAKRTAKLSRSATKSTRAKKLTKSTRAKSIKKSSSKKGIVHKTKKLLGIHPVKHHRRMGFGAVLVLAVLALVGVIPPGGGSAADTWQVYWSDEFNGSSIDTSKWGVYHNTYGDGNKEEACLTPNNVNVSGGSLKITAKRENVACPGKSVDNFTSGFIATKSAGSSSSSATANGKYFPKFAKYEIRAKIPHAQGLWPAFWLRHINGSSTAEVDIMEYFHSQVPGKTSSTLHLDGKSNVDKKTSFFESATTTPGWHTWAVEMQPDPNNSNNVQFKFLLDGNVFFTSTPSQQSWTSKGDPNAMFDIAINMAVGGNYVGHPDDELGWSRYLNKCMKPYNGSSPCNGSGIRRAGFPETYEIDYVRVYTKKSDSTSPTTEPAPAPSTKLATVSDIVATPGDGVLNVTWKAVPGADNYTVRWGTNGNWSYSNDSGKNPTTNSYTITGLNNGTKYDISIAARDTTNTYPKGDYSSGASGTPSKDTDTTEDPVTDPVVPESTDTKSPSQPKNVKKGIRFEWSSMSYANTLTWDKSTDDVGVTEYRVTRNGVALGKTTRTNFIDKSVSTDTRYEYSIQAFDAAENASEASVAIVKGSCFLFWCTLDSTVASVEPVIHKLGYSKEELEIS